MWHEQYSLSNQFKKKYSKISSSFNIFLNQNVHNDKAKLLSI